MSSFSDKINLDGTFNCINCINFIFPVLYFISVLIVLAYDFYNYMSFVTTFFLIGFSCQLIFYVLLRKVKNKLDEQPNRISFMSFLIYVTGLFYYLDGLFFIEYVKQFQDLHDGIIELMELVFQEFFHATLPNDPRTTYIYILVSLASLLVLPLLYICIVFIIAFVCFLTIIIPSINLVNMIFIMYLSGIHYLAYGVEIYRQIKYTPIPEEIDSQL
jgi:hypothetical protein